MRVSTWFMALILLLPSFVDAETITCDGKCYELSHYYTVCGILPDNNSCTYDLYGSPPLLFRAGGVLSYSCTYPGTYPITAYVMGIVPCPSNPSSNPPSCSDGIQNQGETGLDCGGPCSPCPSCPDPQPYWASDGSACRKSALTAYPACSPSGYTVVAESLCTGPRPHLSFVGNPCTESADVCCGNSLCDASPPTCEMSAQIGAPASAGE